MGPRPGFASASTVGAAVATCVITLPSSTLRRSKTKHPGTRNRPGCHGQIVNLQQTAVLTPGQGETREKGGAFPECTNPSRLQDDDRRCTPLGNEQVNHRRAP